MFDPREHKQAPPIEKKSYASGQSFAEYLYSSGNTDLSMWIMIQMYEDAAPFFDAVDRHAVAFSSIPIRLRDKTTKVFVDSHPVLDLLAQPNGDTTGREFLHQLSSYKSITGNSFLYATGPVEQPPLELAVMSSTSISFGATSSEFGIFNVADQMNLSQASGVQMQFFSEDSESNNLFRFFNSKRDAEMWHIRQFSPRRSGARFFGMSKAKPLFLEIQQYLSGNNTNWSNLKRGTRLSMVWMNTKPDPLTDTQWERLEVQAQKYSGDLNAGGTPVLDGVEARPMQQTNRDMEFKELQESMAKHVYTLFRVPLPHVLDGSMTLNNMETADLQWYDHGVLPEALTIYGEMTNFLLPRYPGSENLEFCFSENDIPSLRARVVARAKSLKEVQVNTTDEIRTVLGDEELASGGDTVLVDGSLVPLGEDGSVVDAPVEGAKFEQLLRELKDDQGHQRYSDVEIKEMAVDKGLADGL
jgi:phage portal protein BeeE